MRQITAWIVTLSLCFFCYHIYKFVVDTDGKPGIHNQVKHDKSKK
jgi:hypothetical protein